MTLIVDHIDHVVLNCRDVDRTADWYERVLGMTRVVFNEGRTALAFGNQKLNLRPTGAENWPTATADAPGSEDLCFIVDADPAEVGRQLREAGVEITQGPVVRTGAQGAMTSHYCLDPEGNLVEVASYRTSD
jgi:catechol 2,3-dioxygenase-like lactoylglutathione lyase family enzyme